MRRVYLLREGIKGEEGRFFLLFSFAIGFKANSSVIFVDDTSLL